MTGAPASPFEANRSYLIRLAYRMLGSLSDAEDVVQDAWLRWHDSAPEAIANPRAWLGRVVTRLCLDLMKSARRKRETYVGAWLPEPLIGPQTIVISYPGRKANAVVVATDGVRPFAVQAP